MAHERLRVLSLTTARPAAGNVGYKGAAAGLVIAAQCAGGAPARDSPPRRRSASERAAVRYAVAASGDGLLSGRVRNLVSRLTLEHQHTLHA